MKYVRIQPAAYRHPTMVSGELKKKKRKKKKKEKNTANRMICL